MNGDVLSTLIDELNGGASIGTTLKFQLVNMAKAILEDMRPWKVLFSIDTSKTVTTANTWLTSIDLSTVTRFKQFYGDTPVHIYSTQDSFVDLHEVPNYQRLKYSRDPSTFAFFPSNKSLFIHGTLTFAGTIWIDHLKYSEDLDEDSVTADWPFPPYAYNLLAFMAVGIHKGGVDYDDINARMAPENQGVADVILKRLEAWDDAMQLTAIQNTAPYNTSSGFRSGAIDMGA